MERRHVTHHRTRPTRWRWRLHATTAAFLIGMALCAYWTIGANPLAAGIAALAAGAAMGAHIYFEDRYRN